MKSAGRYKLEFALIAAVMLISILGFSGIYVGADADPQPHHHWHIATVFIWMGLLVAQLTLVAGRSYRQHRKVGLAVLVAGPLLVATSAALAVHSARKGLVSGEGDLLIVQNVMTTLELGLLIFLAFLWKRRRQLHGSLLLSTAILFMGIALFFALIGFAPPFRIEGPETFYRFRLAGTAGQVTCLAVGLLFFVRDPANGWPLLAAAFSFPMNDTIQSLLTGAGLITRLTEVVGSMNQPVTFIAAFALMLSLLAATALPAPRPARAV